MHQNNDIGGTKMKRIQCPCCGYFTIDGEEEAIIDYCEVCGWRYDLPAHECPERKIGYTIYH